MTALWYLWLILAALFIVAELFTTGFVLLWFGVGAIAAALVALSGFAGLPLQFVVFLSVSIGLTVASRTILQRFLPRGSAGEGLKTGMETMPGRVGVVVTASEGALAEAAVRVFGSTWRAYPSEGEEPLREGDRVLIDRVEGSTVYVRKADREPSWRQRKQLNQ